LWLAKRIRVFNAYVVREHGAAPEADHASFVAIVVVLQVVPVLDQLAFRPSMGRDSQ